MQARVVYGLIVNTSIMIFVCGLKYRLYSIVYFGPQTKIIIDLFKYSSSYFIVGELQCSTV